MKNSNFKHFYRLIILFIIAGIFIFTACNKDDDFNLSTDFRLAFSNDSVVFDTVFTSIGSVSKQLRVYNNSDKKINISSIQLLKGEASQYRINIDGSPELTQENIEIAANDSMYVFVRVNIDPDNEEAPFIVNDQIEFNINGNSQKVELVAWGQNANYILADQTDTEGNSYKIIAAKGEDVSWDSPKPYVIYGNAIVDTNAVLRISEGCRIYFHNKSQLQVKQNACLKVSGTLENPVLFKGDRLDEGYRDLPEQWKGIRLAESDQITEINFARIENGTFGILAESNDDSKQNQLTITNTIIKNMSGSGLSSRAFSISAGNLLIADCGGSLLNIEKGGTHTFTHCTFANFWNRSYRGETTVCLSNTATIDEQSFYNNLDIVFKNCIIDGSSSEELTFDEHPEADFLVSFSYCSLRTLTDETNTAFEQCIFNPEILFEEAETINYKLHADSPLIDAANPNFSQPFPFDILGSNRLPKPDIGAIEYTETNTQNKILRNY